ncbi:MAG: MCP four helix bundle domain-containing protein [Deltaproteobacteria bacterium]|nr:MCP four helix bundle domain-containing protein [Deltaproteobacteria bacterium]
MRISNLGMGFRLGSGFGLMIILVLALGGVAFWAVNNVAGLTDQLYRHPFAVTTAALRVEGNALRMQRAMREAAYAASLTELGAAQAQLAALEPKIKEDFALIREAYLGDQTQVDQALAQFQAWQKLREEVFRLKKDGREGAALELSQGAEAQLVSQISNTLGSFLAIARGKAEAFVGQADQARDTALRIALLLTGLAVAAGLLIAFFLTRGVTRPVLFALTTAQKLAQGDLTMEVRSESQDETGRMLGAMAEMVEKLSDMIGANVNASQVLAEGASEQAASLEETAASLEELSSMTKTNADNAALADKLSGETGQVVAQADSSMGEVRQAMDQLNQASGEMATIIRSIDEIAFQTNLLALNAAVEAARAGETGAGFAVVADEVRNLALRAADAAKQTTDLIETNRQNIANGVNLVGATAERFTSVVGAVAKVSGLVGEIAVASAEQSQGIEQISRAMEEMDKVVQSNAANAEEIAASLAFFRLRPPEAAPPASRAASPYYQLSSSSVPAVPAWRTPSGPPIADPDFTDFS